MGALIDGMPIYKEKKIYDKILHKESVKTWLAFLSQENSGSKNTEESYLFKFNRVCDEMGMDPDRMLAMAKRDLDGFEKKVALWRKDQEGKGQNRKTLKSKDVALRSFMKHNGVYLRHKMKGGRPKLRELMTKDQLRKLLDYCPLKLKAYLLFARDSGLAPVDILALKYGDIKGELEKGIWPIFIHTAREKTDVELHTWIGFEAIEVLKEYLQYRKQKMDERLAKGLKGTDEKEWAAKLKDPYDPGAYLFTIKLFSPKSLTYDGLWNEFRRCINGSGLNLDLYDLRRFFSTQLIAEQGGHRVDPRVIEYWMGHDLGVNRGYILPTIEQQREEYRLAYPLLAFQQKEDERVVGLEAKLKEREASSNEARNRIQQLEEILSKMTDAQQDSNTSQRGEMDRLKADYEGMKSTMERINADLRVLQESSPETVAGRKELRALHARIAKRKAGLKKEDAKRVEPAVKKKGLKAKSSTKAKK